MALDIQGRTPYAMTRYGRGVCFRLSFKWAALSLVGGEFNLGTDGAGLNVESTKTKHVAYRAVSAGRETGGKDDFGDNAVFNDYVDGDEAEALKYINAWGVRFKGSKSSGGTLYNGVSVSQKREERLTETFKSVTGVADLSLVFGFYGRKAGPVPAGHAVAYSKGKFFDANLGVMTCTPPSDAGKDIDAFVDRFYKPKWVQERFVVFILQHSPSTGVPSTPVLKTI